MSIKKEYLYGADAREAIRKVATVIGDTLGKTLGPAGRNYQTPEGITNDGKTILSHIRFPDECEDSVALAFHEIANRQDRDAGDGTTTAVVFGTELVKDLIDKVPDIDSPMQGQVSVMELSRQLEEDKNKVLALLEKKVIPVTTLEQLEQVAFTSMEDRDIAKIVAATIFKAGANSFTALEEGFTGKLETNIQAGIEVPVQLNYGSKVVATECPVLVVNHLFEDYRELSPFIQSMVQFMNENKMKVSSLVIVAKKFSIPFMQKVIENNTMSPLQIHCMSNDHLPDAVFEDVAAFVDAKYMDTHPKGGRKIADVRFKDCGFATKFVATAKGAVFYGGKGTQLQPQNETTRVQARVLELNAELAKETNTKNRTALERRIAEFQGGKATIYVDAKTAAEKYYLKKKIEDCMNSCKGALEGGMVRGGGIALQEVGAELGQYSILASILCRPYQRIQQNAGGILEIGPDVMDSYLCAKAGIENAVSVIRTLITVEGVIADPAPSMVESLKEAINE